MLIQQIERPILIPRRKKPEVHSKPLRVFSQTFLNEIPPLLVTNPLKIPTTPFLPPTTQKSNPPTMVNSLLPRRMLAARARYVTYI